MTAESTPELANWIKRITESEMPIFGRTVQEVVRVSEDDVSSALQLGQVVLKDAAMTASVLKLANSAHYNATGQKFSTISRAIMMLGFDTVRSMCLTVSLIDSLVHGIHREQLITQMARSLHAAAQAQEIAKQSSAGKHEEVYIATLLIHIGDLAFWCFGDEKGIELNEALKKSNKSIADIQKEVLGFSMNELSLGLAQTWGLRDLLKDTLKSPNSTEPLSQAITLSHQLAESVEGGWDSTDVNKITRDIAALTGTTAKKTTERLHNSAVKAAETTAFYGAKAVAKVIPLPMDVKLEDTHELADAFVQPDPLLQLQILQELMSIDKSNGNFNILVEMTLEGINRGVGMDNALFALMTPDRKFLNAKQVIGNDNDWLKKHFKFNLNEPTSRLFLLAMKEGKPIRIDSDASLDLKKTHLSIINTKDKSEILLYRTRHRQKQTHRTFLC